MLLSSGVCSSVIVQVVLNSTGNPGIELESPVGEVSLTIVSKVSSIDKRYCISFAKSYTDSALSIHFPIFFLLNQLLVLFVGIGGVILVVSVS